MNGETANVETDGPTNSWIHPRPRDYALCGWLFMFCAAFFSIAPAKGIGLIVMGFLGGSLLSFLGYGASRAGKSRLAVVLLLLGIVFSGLLFLTGPMLHERMMEAIDKQRAERKPSDAR